MKYKAKFKIETEFECDDNSLLIKRLWDSIEKPFSKCIFGNKKDEELKFITLTDAKGNIINLKKVRKALQKELDKKRDQFKKGKKK